MTQSPSPEAGASGLAPTLTELLQHLLARRRRLVLLALGTAIAVAGTLMLRPRQFTAQASFMPVGRRQPTSLAGLAAQFGVALPASETAQSPAFMIAVLRSRPLQDSVLLSTYATAGGDSTATLLDVLDIEAGTPQERLAVGELKLAARTYLVADPKTGLVLLRVTMPSAELAAAVAASYLRHLDHFNRETRQSQAQAERRFTERRLAESRVELQRAEDALQRFLQANRGFRSSSELAFEEDRLRRELAVRQEVVRSLTQAYEQARIEEVRDTPLLSVVQPPDPPLQPDRRGLAVRTVLGALLGGVVSVVLSLLSLVLAALRRSRPQEYDAVVSALRAAGADVLRPWRLLRSPRA